MPHAVQENVPLAPLTTFGIGGPARYFVNAASETDVEEALDFAASKNVPVFVLGGGSNLLVSDKGFPGLVLKIRIRGVQFESSAGQVLLSAGAGEDWDGIVAQTVSRGLAGVECLSGIPGSVGGTPVQNVGAYGQETSDVLLSVAVFDRSLQRTAKLSHSDCGFTYRTSIFNTTARDRYIVLGVIYALKPGGPSSIKYPDLRLKFESWSHPPSLEDVRQAVREIRASKGMLLVSGDPDCRSAGSFFKNPVVTEEAYQRLQASIAEQVPRYPASEGAVKVSAAWLIEHAGIPRGFAMGSAAISRKHTLALVNAGDAKAADIVRLAREVRSRVEDRFGVRLIPEPVLLGFDEAL
jgi:UDP-N-acetylmuramate dehydrogenase